MNLKRTLLFFGILYPLFVITDFFWFGYVVADRYTVTLKHLVKPAESCDTQTLITVLLVLAFFILGFILFVEPRIKNASLTSSFVWGATYGLVTYGVFAFSNYAYFMGWPISIAVVDTLVWGIFGFGLIGVLLSYLMSTVSE